MLSAYDEPLQKKHKLSFTTPRVEILHTYPDRRDKVALDSPMAIIFNQAIDPEQVLPVVSLALSQEVAHHALYYYLSISF